MALTVATKLCSDAVVPGSFFGPKRPSQYPKFPPFVSYSTSSQLSPSYGFLHASPSFERNILSTRARIMHRLTLFKSRVDRTLTLGA